MSNKVPPSPSQNPDNDPSSQSTSPSDVTQNFQGDVTGVAGNVEGDQNIHVDNSQQSHTDLRGATIVGRMTTIIKKPISLAIAALTAVVGTVGIIFAGKHNVINVQGNIAGNATVANELTIYKGDSPEVRQRKIEQAKQLIAAEVLTNLSNLDAQLGFVGTALDDDDFDNRLRAVRDQVSPALNLAFDPSYRRLMRQQAIASLRNGFTSRPLSELRESLMQVLVEGNVSPERVQAFYDSLTEVRDSSDSLFADLSTAAAQTSGDSKVTEHYQKQVKLAVARFVNRSQTAHIFGLMVLDSLKADSKTVQERLQLFQHLEPRQLINQDEATLLLAKQVEEAQRLVEERGNLVQEATKLRDSSLEQYAAVQEQLTIKVDDPWEKVVGKAVSMRQLGDTTGAVAAFSRYGEMFAATDPTAPQYARIAQQFTLQLKQLDLQGGVYLYQIVEGGAGDRAGLKAGDIVIQYGDKAIANMPDIVMALKEASAKGTIPVSYLRLSNTGVFERQTVTLDAGVIGAGMMPI